MNRHIQEKNKHDSKVTICREEEIHKNYISYKKQKIPDEHTEAETQAD